MDISIRKQRLKSFFEFTVPNTSGNLSGRVNQNNRSPPANSVAIEGLASRANDICWIVQIRLSRQANIGQCVV